MAPDSPHSAGIPVGSNASENETTAELPPVTIRKPDGKETTTRSLQSRAHECTSTDTRQEGTSKDSTSRHEETHPGGEGSSVGPSTAKSPASVKKLPRKTVAFSLGSGRDSGAKKKTPQMARLSEFLKPDGSSKVKDASSMTEEDDREIQRLEKLYDDLMDAIKKGDASVVCKLIQSNKGYLNVKFPERQETILLLALRHGGESSTALVDAILAFEPNVNEQDSDGRTALMSASGRGMSGVVEKLIHRKANVNAQDRRDETALYNAVSENKMQTTQLLLKADANPNIPDSKGRTPLHVAATDGSVEIVNILLSYRAVYADCMDRRGHTPLHEACFKNHETVASALLQHGADVNAITLQRWTPLHIAAQNTNKAIVKDLLDAGADTVVFTLTMDTPEKLAENHPDILKLLNRKNRGDSSAAFGIGKSLRVRQPTTRQREPCEHFKGFVWPSLEQTFLFDKLTVWDMLYNEEPKLRRLEGHPGPVWIHLPANNITWVRDIFKIIYGDEKTSTDTRTRSPSGCITSPIPDTKLPNILQFIDSHMLKAGQHSKTPYREPHYQCAAGPQSSLRAFGNQMISAVIPIIDVDMQQPYFYAEDFGSLWSHEDGDEDDDDDDDDFRTYTTDQGRTLRSGENEHVNSLQDLGETYSGFVHPSRSLDESFYELMDKDDLNHRNGDQVLSRFIARYRVEMEKSRKNATSEKLEKHQTHDGDDRADGDAHGGISYGAESGNEEARSSFNAQEAQPLETDEVSARREERYTKGKEADTSNTKWRTMSQLESQKNATRGRARGWVQAILSKFHKQRNTSTSDGSSSAYYTSNNASSGGSSHGGPDSDDPDAGKDKDDSQAQPPRQQILVVPQLWIWKVENTIVTAFPDRWDSSNNRTLFEMMKESIEKCDKVAEKDRRPFTLEEVLHTLLHSSLGFEPMFSAYDQYRSYQDAFASEIAHVSSQTTACYRRYRRSLGKIKKSFSEAMKTETSLLMTTEDILSEIVMIKRVHEEQALVCAAKQAEDNANANSKSNGVHNSNDNGGSVAKQSERRLSTSYPSLRHLHASAQHHMDDGHSQSKKRKLSAASLDKERVESDSSDTLQTPSRTELSPQPITRLERLEEDARRLRKSIITLLDLRQRQANAENVINSEKQSDILFAQSKVLFIFTIITVFFAPLSWVSSLLALNIDHFSPAASRWQIPQVFGASFGSVVGTLLLCWVCWVVYGFFSNDRVEDRAESRRTKMNRIWRPLLFSGLITTSLLTSSSSGMGSATDWTQNSDDTEDKDQTRVRERSKKRVYDWQTPVVGSVR